MFGVKTCDKLTLLLNILATGSKTAMYNCQDHGDPNDGCDPDKEETELQYFIKWKNWSHIHNTWETEESLVTQKVNGLKKLENYKKREEEITELYVIYLIYYSDFEINFSLTSLYFSCYFY